ncbi:MAG: S24/S26 family peptidase [Fibrobacteria bacterium]|nr:S24/S26 family peptidase [Fibrobacteria bacterium]
MWPFIRPNDTLTVSRDLGAPYFGKVVGFFNGNQFIAHRVVKVSEERSKTYFYFQGDLYPFKLNRVEQQDIVGTVTSIHNRGKRINLWFSSPWCVFPFFISLPTRGIWHLHGFLSRFKKVF